MSDSIERLSHEAVANVRAAGNRRYLLGIAGPPGAGKSTLVEALIRVCSEEIGGECVIGLPMDGFHLTTEQLSSAGLQECKGAPETFDADGFISAIRQLADTAMPPMMWPAYSRELHDPIADAIGIPARAQLIFIEGNYLLLDDEPWKKARDILDSIWYVAAEMDTIATRLRQRQLEGGKTAANADQHVLRSDLKNAALVEETKDSADRIVYIDSTDSKLADLTDPATGRPFVLDRN